MASNAPHTGRFVWYDLMTTDTDAAIKFYSALFGWTTKGGSTGGSEHYTMLQAASKEFGGLMAIDKSRPMPSHWVGYVAVDDIHAVAARVPAAGGRVAHPPTAIPHVGHFAVVVDPQGAAFCLFQGLAADPAVEWKLPLGPGTVVWNELMTSDPPAATRFYKEICGWDVRTEEMGSIGTYWIYSSNGKDCAGMMKMPPDAQAPPSWVSYFHVDDVDASTKKAKELGGKPYVPPTDIPGIGRFSLIADSTGATLALFKPIPR
jgi:uncharacterized protein